MKKVDYASMSDQELKNYMLTHKEDREAFDFCINNGKTVTTKRPCIYI